MEQNSPPYLLTKSMMVPPKDFYMLDLVLIKSFSFFIFVQDCNMKTGKYFAQLCTMIIII